MKSLRPYQRESIDSLYQYWTEGKTDPALIVVPTGGGKSLIMAYHIKEMVEDYDARILVMTHVKELVKQNHDELLELWPEAPAGIYSASLKRKDLNAQVLFAGIQSLHKVIHKLYPAPNIVIIDEAHRIPENEDALYTKALNILQAINPKVKCYGLTATPYRLTTGWLHKGEKSFFKAISYTVDVQMLIDNGWLCTITTKAGKVQIDTSSVHKRGREFVAGELQAAAMANDTTALAVADVAARAYNKKKILVFATGIDHAEQVAETFRCHGYATEIVTGRLTNEQRDKALHRHRAGQSKVLVNVDILTTGYNDPEIDCIVSLRPTESPGLWVQMLGRGMRIAPGKDDCLVLDYTGNAVRHGPIDAISPEYKATSGDGVAPGKYCPECERLVHAAMKHCPYCGFEFPERIIKVERKAAAAPLLKKQIEPETCHVQKVFYRVHKKTGKPDSVRIEYLCGIRTVSEWIFPEAQNQRANYFYIQWCKEAGMVEPYPRTSAEFVKRTDFKMPETITIKMDGKYWKVIRRNYGL